MIPQMKIQFSTRKLAQAVIASPQTISMVSVKILCLLVLGVAQRTCSITSGYSYTSYTQTLADCLTCCPDVVCPAAPPCPKVECGTTEEDVAEVPEPTVYKGPVQYQAIAWASIAMTFIPLTILWFVDKFEVSKASHSS
jgi:hypothetical protein